MGMIASDAIGESSNIAQLAQSYANTFNDDKYWDIVCILSVVAQLAIDSAKRSFDIDITEEIKEIKKSLNIDKNGYPAFWKLIQDKKLHKQNKEFSKEKINNDLQCPMNYLTTVKIKSYKPKFTMWAIRGAVTGRTCGADMVATLAIIGKDNSIKRAKAAIL